jgi:mannose-1-phosphate guanylyltransferase/mannose-1-phosphate guanylyltransferase/phosphomannomutase
MQHNIELLKRYGFSEVTANIHYYPEQIENYFSDGHALGINLSYSFERELLGTAGGVRHMAEVLNRVDSTFLVLSSDALTDINLERMLAFHRRKKALATIALSPVEDVSNFGVVDQDEEHKVIGFQEKPRPEEAQSKLVNAGIYIFEPEILKMIPKGFYDFGKQLFPELAARKAPLYGYRMVEYWSDVGGLEKYILSNYDAMKGAVQIRVPGQKVSAKTWIGDRENIDPSARFEGSVIIGDRCSIGKNVYIKDAVIGDKCNLADGAVVTGSVVWSDTHLGAEANVAGSVIGSFCHVGDSAKVREGSIIANCSVISASADLPSGTRLPPNSIA